MTEEVLFLDMIGTGEGETTVPRMRLAVRAYPSDEKGFISLTSDCETLEGFEQAVRELKESMDTLMQRAREIFQQYQTAEGEGARAMGSQSAKEIWQLFEERDSIEEMREIFNGLGLQKRQEVADFVLTQLNIFKGAASTFSQHYNEQECVLE
jgi:hypothetical protein